jgi:ribosome biogenesis GTPase
MGSKRKKPRENDLAERYRAGDFNKEQLFEIDEEKEQRFSSRNKNATQNKIEQTAALRAALVAAAEAATPGAADALPVGQVTLVYSLFCEVEFENRSYLCVTRKTLTKLSDTQIVVGDFVRFRDTKMTDETGKPQGVIEETLPRETVLTRTDSFKLTQQHAIVANADQMLIVASVKSPAVKWGLVDRMIVAARSGGLVPIVCLNKIDLVLMFDPEIDETDEADDESVDPREALSHYLSIGVQTLETSVDKAIGLAELKELLTGKVTVLAGHSGVGKSSLIGAIQPAIDIRIGAISGFTGKGRHTTTSARRYPLDFGGAVIDTPGVKLFGLWNVSRESLIEFFPDVAGKTAPRWRVASYERIAGTL